MNRGQATPTAGSPAFSVVVPTYDRPELVARAVASVLAQDFTDFELLVVDDASPRDPAPSLARFDDPRLRLVRRPANGGAAAALNTGIAEAKGRLISFLGDDDQLHSSFLGVTHEVFREAPLTVGFTWTGVREVEDTPDGERMIQEGVWSPSYPDREAAYRGFLLDRKIGSNCGVTVRADAIREVGGFDETMRRAEDTDLFLRLVRRFDFRVIPSVEVTVHRHDGPRLTTYDREFARSYERILAANTEDLENDPETWVALHYKLGWLHLHGGDAARGRSYLLRALRKRPWHLKSLGALLLFGVFGQRAKEVHRRISTWKKGWGWP